MAILRPISKNFLSPEGGLTAPKEYTYKQIHLEIKFDPFKIAAHDGWTQPQSVKQKRKGKRREHD